MRTIRPRRIRSLRTSDPGGRNPGLASGVIAIPAVRAPPLRLPAGSAAEDPLVPASGTPVISDASSVRARRSSGSRSWTSRLPQARARIWISAVTACNQLATRSAAGVDVQAFHQLRVLRGDADRTAAGVAVMAGVRRGADGVVVLDVERLVAVQRDQGRGADVDGVGAQGQGLGHVAAVAQAAGDDQLHRRRTVPSPPGRPGPRRRPPASECRCAPAAGRARRRCRLPCRPRRPRRRPALAASLTSS